MYSNGFDLMFFMKNLILTISIGVMSWYFLAPIFIDASRTYGLGLIVVISIITALPFIILNMKEGKMFLGELRKMKKGV